MSMNDVIQDALDDLASSRSSTSRKGRALNTLERLLADICIPTSTEASEQLTNFIALQDTFQCNVPSRLVTWISESSNRLEVLTSKGTLDEKKATEVSTLSTQIVQALSIIQGVALSHSASKRYLGRKYTLEVLIDLLLTSRHVGTPSFDDTPKSPTSTSEPLKTHGNRGIPSVPLSSAVLDTLLCIMVDSSPSLRAFENISGVQSVVKILKRAGTPREVRMKCLEFLYFYLMDENSSLPASVDLSGPGLVPPTSPRSPNRSSHRPALSLSTMSQISDSSTVSSHSASSSVSSNTSFSATSSATSVSSRASSMEPEGSPNNLGMTGLKPSLRILTPPQPRNHLMLRKDLDFVPITPKKAQIAKLGVGTPRTVSHESRLYHPGEVLSSEDTEPEDGSSGKWDELKTPRKIPPRGLQRLNVSSLGDVTSTPKVGHGGGHRRAKSSVDAIRSPPMSPPPAVPPRIDGHIPRTGMRTMEEKKEFLGSMLGNVDALVEGVRKAGIWGLC